MHITKEVYPRAAGEVLKALCRNVFVERKGIYVDTSACACDFGWSSAETKNWWYTFDRVSTERDGQHVIIVSRAACGWNVCAVNCKFARKHIPRRTWVHSGDVMRRSTWGVEINRTSELLYGQCVYSRALRSANSVIAWTEGSGSYPDMIPVSYSGKHQLILNSEVIFCSAIFQFY